MIEQTPNPTMRSAVIVGLCCGVLTACGGGGASSAISGNGAGSATQLSAGVVTGFGSVFVDGERLDDSSARIVVEQSDGSSTNAALQLGQRVRVSHDGAGRASRVVVDAAVIGKVASVDSAAGTLTVAGQVIAINTDSSAGPITFFGSGFTGLSDVAAGVIAEVHGTPVFIGGQWVVRATRIDRRTDSPGIKVSGVVANLSTGATVHTFSVGGLLVDFSQALTGMKVTPSPERLTDGAVVKVFAAASGLSGSTLVANAVRIGGDGEGVVANTVMQLSGLVSNYDVGARSFRLEGLTVRVGDAQITPASSALGQSSWVRVAGLLAADGAVDATRIDIRQGDVESDAAKIRLIGPVSDVDSESSFVVRELAVDASAVVVRPGCTTLTDGVVVDITARTQEGSDVLRATALSCLNPPAPEKTVRPAGGRITAIDDATKTMTVLTPDGQSQQIRWTEATAFVGSGLSSAEQLTVGTAIRAEGLRDGERLVAKVIALQGARPVDRFRRPAPPLGSGNASEASGHDRWNEYFSHSRP